MPPLWQGRACLRSAPYRGMWAPKAGATEERASRAEGGALGNPFLGPPWSLWPVLANCLEDRGRGHGGKDRREKKEHERSFYTKSQANSWSTHRHPPLRSSHKPKARCSGLSQEHTLSHRTSGFSSHKKARLPSKWNSGIIWGLETLFSFGTFLGLVLPG